MRPLQPICVIKYKDGKRFITGSSPARHLIRTGKAEAADDQSIPSEMLAKFNVEKHKNRKRGNLRVAFEMAWPEAKSTGKTSGE
jgi:hypothetical protein